MTSKVQPAAGYWIIDSGDEVVLFFGEQKNKEQNGKTPLQ